MSPVLKKLLRWYRTNKRDLPWRDVVGVDGKPDAYKIFLSEIMLQQTNVKKVIPKFESFLETFPSWESLASASNADAIRAWSGLGYNRRALMVRDAARRIRDHGVPNNEDEWRALPGVGPYTAAALVGFINRKRGIAIDTNVRRVAGRALCGIPYPQLSDHGRVHGALANATPKRGKTWEIPSAFMDLGSRVCTTKNPDCRQCPISGTCGARKKLSAGATYAPLKKSVESRHRNKPYPDRIYRGRILSHIGQQPTSLLALGKKIDPAFDVRKDMAWLRRMIDRLIREQLAERKKKKIFLSSRK